MTTLFVLQGTLEGRVDTELDGGRTGLKIYLDWWLHEGPAHHVQKNLSSLMSLLRAYLPPVSGGQRPYPLPISAITGQKRSKAFFPLTPGTYCITLFGISASAWLYHN